MLDLFKWAMTAPLLLLTAAFLSGCGEGTPKNDIAQAVQTALATLPTDGEQNPPALSAAVIAILAQDMPELEQYQADIERREKAALKTVIADYHAWQTERAGAVPVAMLPAHGEWHDYQSNRPFALLDLIVTPARAMGDAPTAPDGGDIVATLGGNVATKTFGSAADGAKSGQAGQHSVDFKGEDGESASLNIAVDETGQVTGSIASNTEIPQLGVGANSKVSLVTKGLCPDTAGRVEFTIKLSQGGQAGPGGSNYSRNLEAHVVATVNDNAEVADAQINTKYDQRLGKGEKTSTMAGRTNWNSPGGPNTEAQVVSNTITEQSGDSATVQKMANDGARHSLMLGTGALIAAEQHWQGGHCVRIDATSPGKISPGKRSEIPVKVFSRQDAAEVTAKVTATLTGGKTIDPTEIPRSPGTITHTAPDERTKSMSIKLVTVSRRGKAELTLTMSMSEGQYRAEGGAGEFHGTGVICDLAKPFTISGSGVTMQFTPTSEDGGTYTYSGSMSGFAVQGSGTYTVGYTDYGETASGLYATGPGSVKTPMGVMQATDDEEYNLTKITDDSCSK